MGNVLKKKDASAPKAAAQPAPPAPPPQAQRYPPAPQQQQQQQPLRQSQSQPQPPPRPQAPAPALPQQQVQAQQQPAVAAEEPDEVKVTNVEEREQNIEEKDTAPTNADESYSFWDRNKTFKPVKKPITKKQNQLQQTIKATMKATLGGGELRKTVQLPQGEDLNEWIAVNTVHFYNAANMIYGTCTEFCTEQSCPVMCAGPKYEYLWKDGIKYKKPTKVSAPVYIDNLLNWVNDQISDPELFPVDENAKFPKNFVTQIKQIYKRLFRLYAHIYYAHFEQIRSIGANAHLNTCFKHFVFFVLEFDLVDKDEMAPLKKLIDKFTK